MCETRCDNHDLKISQVSKNKRLFNQIDNKIILKVEIVLIMEQLKDKFISAKVVPG